jgi:hypothetical protein
MRFIHLAATAIFAAALAAPALAQGGGGGGGGAVPGQAAAGPERQPAPAHLRVAHPGCRRHRQLVVPEPKARCWKDWDGRDWLR